jgi:predicted PurR-regulated permease PerM
MPNALIILALLSMIFITMAVTKDKIVITSVAVIVFVVITAFILLCYTATKIISSNESYVAELKNEIDESRNSMINKINNLTRKPVPTDTINEINAVIDSIVYNGVTTEYFVVLDVITDNFSNNGNETIIPVLYHLVMDHIDFSIKNEEKIKACNKALDELVNGKYFKYLFIKHERMEVKQ